MVVGRAVELDVLERALAAAVDGPGSCIVLRGEAGVGKTRLLGEVAARARRSGTVVLTGRAPISTPPAFSVISEALRSWLRGRESPMTGSPYDEGLRLVLPERSRRGDTEAAPDLSSSQLHLLALEGIVQLVREIVATTGSAVVLLDDLHGADPESLEALRYLASAAIGGTVIIGALRPAESVLADDLVRALDRDGTGELVDVSPLPEREVSDLVAALLDGEPPAPLVADVMARTDGVPLLVEEVLDAHVRAGSVVVDAGRAVWRGGTASVPKTVREMVEARLGRLPRAQRDVIVASAIVASFDVEFLALVADDDVATVHDALSSGIDIGLLETTTGALGFRHAVIREAVVDSAAPYVVERAHRRAEAALAERSIGDAGLLERRASHLLALGADDDAARALAAAARVRLAEHMLLGGELLARTALERADKPVTRADASDALAEVLAAQGRWADALAADQRTVEEHGETPARRERMALSAIEAGRPQLATPIIERAFAAGDTSPLTRIAAGRAALVAGDATRALEHAAAVTADDLDAWLGALELQGRAFDFLGERERAEEAWTLQAERAAAAGRTQAQLRAVVQLGKVELFAGRAPVRLHEAVRLAREAGALVELAWAEENLAIALGVQGDVAGSNAVLARAIPRCRELRLDQLAYLLACQAICASFTTEDVEALVDEAETLAPTDDLLLHTLSIRADIALRHGRYDEAVELLERSAEIVRAMPGIVPIDSPCWLVWALAAVGRDDDAARALDAARAMPGLARWHGRPVIVEAGAALLDRDAEHIDSVLAGAPGRMPFDIALMRLIGAEVLRGSVRKRWLREALDTYEAGGATLMADRVRGLLRAAGGSVPRRPRRATGDVPAPLAEQGVTAREADVLRLLRDGLSNADIAQRLYISVRTVETHVSSLLTKLDARGRGQLIALSAAVFPEA